MLGSIILQARVGPPFHSYPRSPNFRKTLQLVSSTFVSAWHSTCPFSTTPLKCRLVLEVIAKEVYDQSWKLQ